MPKPEMKYWMDARHSPVIAELVVLAAARTGKKIEYREDPDHYHNAARWGRLWSAEEGYVGDFTDELNRLQSLVTKPLDEPILDDDHPVHQGYLYVANGKPVMFIDGMNMTVGRWKALRIEGVAPVIEVRRCDQVGRQLRAPAKREDKTKREIISARPHGQLSRRRRNSNKIKKVG